jgi:predicted glycosyltransferase
MSAGQGRSILFYVQHLLGIGHVYRATRVARALVRHGFSVHIAWGGTRLPSIDLAGLEVTWLEPVRAADAEIAALVRPDGTPAGEELLARRRETLLSLLNGLKPDIVITEAFPFGRRKMQFELIPFMQAARAAPWHPMTVASIRDIMAENRKEARARESIRMARDWYDIVLVHGDPSLIRIEATLQYADEIAAKVRYTGIVAPELPDLSKAPSIRAEVVVSAGGGAVGHALTKAAIGANSYSRLLPDNWLLVVGPERAEADYDALRRLAGEGMRVVQFVPDLTRVMASAKVSASRAGYNTVADVMRAGCRAVLCPFEGGQETEQLHRAKLFERRGMVRLVRDGALDARALGAAVDEAVTFVPQTPVVDLNGAEASAKIIAAELARHKADRRG